MKRFVVLLLVALPVLLKAQVISGKVFLEGTTTPINNASIYINGSTNGTSTDASGSFSLKVDNTLIPLIISCVGFYSTTTADYSIGKPLIIYLKTKAHIMHVVDIGSDGMSRIEKMKLFKREFLGTTSNAQSCIITNEDDIELKYIKSKTILTAECSSPIVIQNKKLGYTLHYYLDDFNYNKKGNTIFTGNCLFKETQKSKDANELKEITKRREDVYAVSRMYFIRALWSNHIEEAGITLYNSEYEGWSQAGYDGIIKTDSAGNKYLMPYVIRVVFFGDIHHISSITKKTPLAYIDKNGFYGAGLQWSGQMSKQRVGDLLPFEYKSPLDITINQRRRKTVAQ
jgi:hypothetical protein